MIFIDSPYVFDVHAFAGSNAALRTLLLSQIWPVSGAICFAGSLALDSWIGADGDMHNAEFGEIEQNVVIIWNDVLALSKNEPF